MPHKNRRSVRLQGYDYGQPGAYFITICSIKQTPLFGTIQNQRVVLSREGEIIKDEWFRSADIRQEIDLFEDEFILMPNHLHGIVWIKDEVDNSLVGATGRSPLPGERPRGPSPRSLGSLIAGFKSSATVKINQFRQTPGKLVWQRNYYEHIIRSDDALNHVREYIIHNPMNWELDRYHPDPVDKAEPFWDTL